MAHVHSARDRRRADPEFDQRQVCPVGLLGVKWQQGKQGLLLACIALLMFFGVKHNRVVWLPKFTCEVCRLASTLLHSFWQAERRRMREGAADLGEEGEGGDKAAYLSGTGGIQAAAVHLGLCSMRCRGRQCVCWDAWQCIAELLAAVLGGLCTGCLGSCFLCSTHAPNCLLPLLNACASLPAFLLPASQHTLQR